MAKSARTVFLVQSAGNVTALSTDAGRTRHVVHKRRGSHSYTRMANLAADISALIRNLTVIAESLSYQSECRPRPSRSREALRAAVADLHDAVRQIELEEGLRSEAR